jgi:CDP-glucose 4,6-dehydratase
MDFLLGKLLNELNGPILVTGHTGFKGTWLTLLLEKLGVPVVGLSLPPAEESLYSRLKRQNMVPEVYGDIRNYSTIAKSFERFQPAAVIHMAAQPLVIESFRSPIETFETNVMGTVNILDISVKSNFIKGIVVATTDKVYRNDELGRRFLESDPLSGKDPYSASKVGSEAAVSAWRTISSLQQGPPIVSVRAGNVIGGGDFAKDRLIPDAIRDIFFNVPLKIRSMNSSRPWQHVLDPLYGYLKTLEAVLGGDDIESLNFGPTEESFAVREVLALMEEISNYRFSEFGEKELSKSIHESQYLALDSSSAKVKINWTPRLDQRNAIIQTYNWWYKVEHLKISTQEACDSDLDFFLNRVS